jgi:acyl-CoA thioesterase
MTHRLVAATTPLPAPTSSSPHRHTLVIDETWLQGKGAYGGVVSAALARVAMGMVDPRRTLRTITVSFCAPARPGVVTIDAHIVREGARISTIQVTMLADDAVVATALCTCAAPRHLTDELRAAAAINTAVMPTVPSPHDVDALPVDVPMMPTFTRQLEWRFCFGDVPGGGGEAKVGAWLRFREAGLDVIDAPVVVALLDVLPPALLSALPMMVPAASVEWSVQLLSPLPRPLRADDHLLVTAVTRVATDGYAEELDELWTHDGVLLGIARQTYAIV